MKKELNIALIGCGNWGKNIARNCQNLNVLYSVTDTDKNKSKEFSYFISCKTFVSSSNLKNKRRGRLIISCHKISRIKFGNKRHATIAVVPVENGFID